MKARNYGIASPSNHFQRNPASSGKAIFTVILGDTNAAFVDLVSRSVRSSC